jgi:hypothetical protein
MYFREKLQNSFAVVRNAWCFIPSWYCKKVKPFHNTPMEAQGGEEV